VSKPPPPPPPPPVPRPPLPQRTNSTVNRYCQELENYLLTLPAHANSIAAVLQAEYNTAEKAAELQAYYADRPALQAYTIQKELPRMEYILTDHNHDVVTDKRVIGQHLATTPSLCARCANQSLLADMLQVLTGPDRVVRPQYMTSAVAVQCRFRVDLQHSLTEVVAALDLTLPCESSGSWKVAEIRLMIIFGCGNQPFVEYRLADIQLTASPDDPDWNQRLEQCASLLSTLTEEEEAEPAIQQNQGQNFRDFFLQITIYGRRGCSRYEIGLAGH